MHAVGDRFESDILHQILIPKWERGAAHISRWLNVIKREICSEQSELISRMGLITNAGIAQW